MATISRPRAIEGAREVTFSQRTRFIKLQCAYRRDARVVHGQSSSEVSRGSVRVVCSSSRSGTEAKLDPPQIGSQQDRSNAVSENGQLVKPEPAMLVNDNELEDEGNTAIATIGFVLGLGTMIGLGYVFRESIDEYLDIFSKSLQGQGLLGIVEFSVLYTVLEILAVPAIPLTMTAGAIFGPYVGTGIVTTCATAAATASFLLARYIARDRIEEIASKDKNFAAIDKAIGEDSFRIVLFLRLSPLLPLALSNYFYGLTSVRLRQYVLASFLGMFPGTLVYVLAGSIGRTAVKQGIDNPAVQFGSLGVLAGFGFSVFSAGYVAKIVRDSIRDSSSSN